MKENWIEELLLAALTLWTICPVEIVQGKSLEATYSQILTCTTTKYYKSEHSLIKSYHENGTAGWNIPHWTYEGSTLITQDFVRLTPSRPDKFGLLRNIDPTQMKNWEVELQFGVHDDQKEGDRNGTKTRTLSIGNNGLAFWYMKTELRPGPFFGTQNDADDFEGFGVVISKESTETEDTSFIYPVINQKSTKSTSQIPSNQSHQNEDRPTQKCEVRVRNLKNGSPWLRIRYSYGTLSVWTDLEGNRNWKNCFSVEATLFPSNQYFFGVSASTADTAPDRHDIIAIKTYELEFEGETLEGTEWMKEHMDPCRKMPMSTDTILKVLMVDQKYRGIPPSQPGLNVLVMPLVVLVVIVALCVAANQLYPNASQVPNMPVRFH